MARIDWALVCDLAFFDRQDRLCIVGIVQKLSTADLPIAIGQVMLVAHLTDIQPVDEVEISVAVVTPSGLFTTPRSSDCVAVEVAHEYVLVVLRELPLHEEGIYKFQLALQGGFVASVDVPVRMLDRPVPATARQRWQ